MCHLAQILKVADGAFFLGMIDTQQRAMALAQQLEIAQLVSLGAHNYALDSVNLNSDAGIRQT